MSMHTLRLLVFLRNRQYFGDPHKIVELPNKSRLKKAIDFHFHNVGLLSDARSLILLNRFYRWICTEFMTNNLGIDFGHIQIGTGKNILVPP